MRAKVTAAGLLIPKELLGNLDEVEIQQENGFVVVMPFAEEMDLDFEPIISEDDPIYQLGRNPIDIGITDTSVAHARWGGQGPVPPIAENMDVDIELIVADDDPIHQLGKNPSKLGITDASINHDRYVYPYP